MASPSPGFGLNPVVDAVRRVFCCHRATLSGRLPPNSLPAVAECIEAGVPRLEIDVRFLADDSMLVFHDAELAHETTGTGSVDRLSRPEAQRLRYRSDAAAGLCFLHEVVDLIRRGSTLLQVDLKLMRPISAGRFDALRGALEPIRERVLIGSQAHWNLRGLAAAGIPVAIDPTLQWNYRPGRSGEGLIPGRLGVHGLWDDAPIAHIRHASAADYCAARVADIVGLLPEAREWMVDVATIQHLGRLGFPLGPALAERGVELAAWTMRDEGFPATSVLLREMFDLGATTVITDYAEKLAGYVARMETAGSD